MFGDAGPVLVMAAAALPPPPRRGLAIRPKLNDEELAAFCAKRRQIVQPKTTVRTQLLIRTARLVEPFLHRLQLHFELLVLQCQPTVGILEQSFEVLYPLVASQQLALRDTRFFLEGRVLVHELRNLHCSRISRSGIA